MINIILPALIAGFFISFISAPLGTFVVWRKMAYFGDTLSHATLLGVVLGLALDWNFMLSTIIFVLILAIILVFLESQQKIAVDTILGILAHGSLSIGIVLMYFIGFQSNLVENYLLGDILSISYVDLYFIIPTVLVIGIILVLNWTSFLYITISPELAQSHGINLTRSKLIFTLLLALTIGIAFKFVGALVITAMLIIPVAIARFFSKTPEQMALIAIVISIFTISLGFVCSAFYDTPSGPTIVALCSILFIIILILDIALKKIHK